MPRRPRLDIPGLLQHVIVRGIEKCDIFLDDDDRFIFLNRFSALLDETNTQCFAWSLMTNHFHLLLRCNKVELSRFMRRLLTGYAVNFNRRYNRSGHLFQNRYKSIVCEEDAYFLELVRYIHLNPLRAGIVADLKTLEVYPWSGHAVLLGGGTLPGQEVDEVLVPFGKRLSVTRGKYRQFVADGVSQGRRSELVGGGLRRSRKAAGGQEEIDHHDDRVLGDGGFVDRLQREEAFQDRLTRKLSLPELQRIISELFGIDLNAIMWRSRSNKASDARAVFCYAGVKLFKFSGAEVGRYLSIGPSAVSRTIRRGEIIYQSQPAIKRKILMTLNQ